MLTIAGPDRFSPVCGLRWLMRIAIAVSFSPSPSRARCFRPQGENAPGQVGAVRGRVTPFGEQAGVVLRPTGGLGKGAGGRRWLPLARELSFFAPHPGSRDRDSRPFGWQWPDSTGIPARKGERQIRMAMSRGGRWCGAPDEPSCKRSANQVLNCLVTREVGPVGHVFGMLKLGSRRQPLSRVSSARLRIRHAAVGRLRHQSVAQLGTSLTQWTEAMHVRGLFPPR